MIAADERVVTLDDGAKTTVTQWGSAGPIMLCVHGLASSRIGWRRVAERFEDRYRVVAYDQRGHADSAQYVEDQSIERVVGDFVSVANALAEPIAIAMGHSWGGAVAIAGSPSADVRSTIAIDPAIRQISSLWYDEYLEELQPVFALHGSERDAFLRDDYASAHPLDREGKVHAMHSMHPEGLINIREHNPAERWNLLDRIAEFPLPLLIALADPAETIVSGEDFKALETMRNPMVRVQIFPGADHSLHRSAFDAFADAVDAFIGQSERMH